jgi:Ion channel
MSSSIPKTLPSSQTFREDAQASDVQSLPGVPSLILPSLEGQGGGQLRNARTLARKGLRAHKFLLLFVYLLVSLVLYPFVREGSFSFFAFRVLGGAGIVLTVYAISLRRTLLVFALLLAVPAVLQRVLSFRADAGALSVLNIVLSFAFDVFVVVAIFRRVFTQEEAPSSETIFGALCIYLLVGFSFSSVYGMVATLQPGAFYLDPKINWHTVPDRFDFVYYSFATMTSLGSNGMTAVAPQARSAAIIEAILGVLYLAVLIARLMTAYRPPSIARGE